MTAPAEPGATKKQWLAVFGSLLGAFMAILDISITNASLKDIQGGLSATLDEGSWISTAYLIAEIIVIPLTGFLSRVFSLKKYLLWNTAAFIASSILCGFAPNLVAMIFFRILQGFSGGVLIPLAITIVMTHLPRRQQPIGMTLFGLAVTFAPCIGPTVGGWLTVNYGWPYIFYINLFPGLLLIAILYYALAETPLQTDLLKHADWWGIGFMAAALGSLTVVLEEGVRDDWFGSSLIVTLTFVCVFAFAAVIVRELTAKNPFINLRLLTRRNFLLTTLMGTIFGYGIFGSLYMLPYFLASIQKLDAEQIGQIMMWQGIPQFFILPFIPFLVKRFDARVLLGVGLLLFGTSWMANSHVTQDWAKDQFFWTQILRALGQPFFITPLTTIAYFGIEPSEIGSAAGLSNMMRNLGGSIGIGTLGALLNHQYHLHFTRLAESTSAFSIGVQEQLHDRAALFAAGSPVLGKQEALASIFQSLNQQALVMSFGDCFLWMGFLFYFGAFLLIFTKGSGGAVPASAGAH